MENTGVPSQNDASTGSINAAQTASDWARAEVASAITAPFTDTNIPEVLAAYALGIVNGTSETTFNPSGSIIRQKSATSPASPTREAAIR